MAVSRSSLRIFTAERLGETFNQTVCKLRYTPRQQVMHPTLGVIAVVEADYGVLGVNEREAPGSGDGAEPMKARHGCAAAAPERGGCP